MGTAVVDNDSWVPVKVEVVVFVEDLLDLFHDASVVVSSQSLDHIMWVSTESTVEELVELAQVNAGALQRKISFISLSLFIRSYEKILTSLNLCSRQARV